MTSPSATLMIDLALTVAAVAALLVLITRLRHQQAAVSAAGDNLKRSEERFRRLAESSPLGIFELDANGTRVYANPKLLAMNAIDGEPGTTKLSFPWNIPAEDVAHRLEEWRAASLALKPYSGRWRIQRPDGAIRWVRFEAAPLVENDECSGWIGSRPTPNNKPSWKSAPGWLSGAWIPRSCR